MDITSGRRAHRPDERQAEIELREDAKYMRGVPRGNFLKDIPWEGLHQVGLTIRLEGVVAA
jgi:hypothetical protein